MTNSSLRPAGTRNGLVLAGLIVSIVGLLLSFVGGGILLGIVALVLLFLGVRRGGRSTMSTVGFVLAGAAILISIVLLILGGVLAANMQQQ